ncbi:MAG: amidohydrolase family protein [Ectothiorhodospiraceae bacterium]|nr:amidohydrolase family protein [Chromatiales bacterium]MCP5156978.1 amidohydrolase family protein [Ectothiorhodospiraceae bacterium]
MAEPADLLISRGHLLTMAGDGVGYLADGAVAVRGRTIVAVGPSVELEHRYDAATRIDASGHAVLPGLVDVHMHTHFAVVRGVAQDVGHWMQGALAPYARHLDHAAAAAGCALNVVEAMLAGTTTMSDYLRPFPGWGEIYARAGVRAVLTPTINALPPGGMAGWRIGDLYPLDEAAGEAALARALEVVERWHGAEDGRITTMLGPQGPDMASRELLGAVRREAERRDLSIHMHVAQGDREIEQMVKRHGKRTPAYLADIGYLDARLLAVHLTEATDEETDQIAASGARMALCSGSIGIIDGIVPPAARFKAAGGVVGLGSDQASGNNCNNVFNEMKLTALFNKIRFRDPTVMPAGEVLRMATIDGARALGLGHRIGSLEVGKEADVVTVSLREPNLLPVLDHPVRTIVPNLVYAGTGKEVRTVVVAGRVVVRDREVLTLDVEAVMDRAQAEGERIARAVAADPLASDLALARATDAGRL